MLLKESSTISNKMVYVFELISKKAFISTVTGIFSDHINNLLMDLVFQYFSSNIFAKNHTRNTL